MSKVHPPYDNSSDLYEVVRVLWNSKGKIISIIFVAALFGITYALYKPNLYEVSSPLYRGSSSAFLKYTSLNDLLKTNDFNMLVTQDSVFSMFVKKFNNYEELVDVLSENEHVKQSIQNLDELQKQRAIFQLFR